MDARGFASSRITLIIRHINYRLDCPNNVVSVIQEPIKTSLLLPEAVVWGGDLEAV